MKIAHLTFLAVAALSPLLGATAAMAQADASQQILHQMEEQQRRSDRELAEQTAQNQRDFTAFVQNSTAAAAANAGPVACVPKFSVKAGQVASGTTVTITCPTPGAVIYYTTNGWTPTTSSRRYSAPFTVLATTDIQAFATAPDMANSFTATAKYTVQGPPLTVFPLTVGADEVLHAKTRLHLATASTLTSKSAKVGEKLPLVLDQDIKVGDAIAIPKGTPVDATITAVTKPAIVSSPGKLKFTVHDLTVGGSTIALQGGEELDGAQHIGRTFALWFSIVGSIPAVMLHGDNPTIQPGMKFTVAVAADTPLKISAANATATP